MGGQPPEKLVREAEDDAKIALVLGCEGTGLSHQAAEATEPVGVPMPGGAESLNVAVAGGILMYALMEPSSRLHEQRLDAREGVGARGTGG